MEAKKRDLKPGDFPQNLKWSDSEATTSLELLYQYVNNECNRAAGWYFVKKKTMKTLGYIFRVGSILALAFAGVIPILGEIFEKGDVPGISPAWSTLFLAIAGVFLSLDSFLLDFQGADSFLDAVQFLRNGVDRDAQLRCGFVEQIDGLIRQETISDITIREFGRSNHGCIGYLDTMKGLIAIAQAA